MSASSRLFAEGLFEELRELRRHVAERYDNATEALQEAEGWQNLRLPPAVTGSRCNASRVHRHRSLQALAEGADLRTAT
jgi:hypothetical protein